MTATTSTDGRAVATSPTRQRPTTVPAWLERTAAFAWRVLVVGAAIYFLLILLTRVRVAVLPLIVAMFLSSALVPVARWFRRRGLRPLLATWAAFGGFLLVLAGVIMVVVPALVREFSELGPTLQQGVEDIESWLVEGPVGLEQRQIDQFREQAGSSLQGAQGGIVTGAMVVFEVVAGFVLSLVLTFFIVKDGDLMQRWMVSRLPSHRRDLAKALGRRGWSTIGGYLRGTATLGLIEGTIIGIALLLVGAHLVIPVAVLTFLAAFVPLVGAVTAGVIATLVALVSGGFTDALIVGGVALFVQQFDNDLLAPLVLGRAVRLHPLVILLAITAGSAIAGLIGAFLGVPTAAVLAALGNEWREWHERNAKEDPIGVDPPVTAVEA